MRCSQFIVILASAVTIQPISAYQTIAHRGLFHDVNDKNALAENSVDALYRAAALGLPGVEFDLRLSSDNQVMITHDIQSNRATVVDNHGRDLNSIDVSLNLQPAVDAIFINSRTSRTWSGTGLKTFGRNGRTIQPDGAQKMETLDAMLSHFKNLNQPNFWLILDIQDPVILSRAGSLVKKYNLGSSVFLKFFATKAINSEGVTYNGNDTCYRYARENNLDGLQIILQFNDGELAISGQSYTINVFNTQLTVQAYLTCWADAQKAHAGNGAALMPIVSASVTANNDVAYLAAQAIFAWARSEGRKTMSILPNPDAGRNINGQCTLWTYQSGSVKAMSFDESARKWKQLFVGLEKPDYVVLDLMGDLGNRRWIGDYSSYIIYLC